MAIVEAPEFFYPPPVPWNNPVGDPPDFISNTLNDTNRKISFLLQVPKNGQLEAFEFKVGSVSQTPANGLKVSFQDVSADGKPDGSADYFYTITSGSVSANAWTIPPYLTDDGTSGGNRKSVSQSSWVACVIEFVSFVSGDSVVIQSLTQDTFAPKGAFVAKADVINVWTKIAGIPILALVYDGGDYVSLTDAYPVYSIGNDSISPSTTPDEIGLTFTLLAPMRVGGAYIFAGASEFFNVTLYDTETDSILEQIGVEQGSFFESNQAIDYVFVRFETNRLLQANRIYVLSVAPVGSGFVDIYSFNAYSTAQMDSMPCGAIWSVRTRADAGDWTEILTSHPLFGLLVTGVDHSISGGSGGSGWDGDP